MSADVESKVHSTPDYGGSMIKAQLDELLEQRGKSLYWLQQQTGFAYTTLWKLRTGKADSIKFDVLDKICTLLECAPGDVLVQVPDGDPVKAKRGR